MSFPRSFLPPLPPALAVVLALVTGTAARADLVSHWPLDGNLNDRGPARRHAAKEGGPAIYVGGASGESTDRALLLDGTDDAAVAPGGVSRERQHSIAFWIRVTGVAGRVLYSEVDAVGPILQIETVGTDRGDVGVRIRIVPGGGGALVDRTSALLIPNDRQWHHVAWVDIGTFGVFYVDGVLDPSRVSHSAIARTPTQTLLGRSVIGRRLDPCCHLAGELDDVRNFNHSLSREEIEAIALRPCDPVENLQIDPVRLSIRGGDLTITSSGFEDDHEFWVGTRRLSHVRLAAGRVRVFVEDFTPGLYDVSVRCPDGRTASVLRRALEIYDDNPCQPALVSVTAIEPDVISADTPTVIELRGTGFDPSFVYSVGDGNPLTNVSVVSSELVRGTTPALRERFYPLFVQCATGELLEELDDAIEVTARLRLTSVTPNTAPVDGGTALEIRGTAFRAETRIFIGELPLENARLVSGGGVPPRIVGDAPAGLAPGPVDVRAIDSRGASTLEEGLTYTIPSGLPGPQQIEASYAEGRVRFTWYAPAGMGTVRVQDEAGRVLAVAEEGTNQIEITAEVAQDRVFYLLAEGPPGTPPRREAVRVGPKNCPTPPPLDQIVQKLKGRFQGLEYEDVEFSLYGAHAEASVTRCVDPAGAVAAFEPPNRAGALAPGTGYKFPRPRGFSDSEVTTGFVLERAAKRIEIALHYRKIETTFGLQLRGRIAKVGPEPGFVDEFTFPDTVFTDTNDWHLITYFRADSDVGAERVDEGDPGPMPCAGDECGGLLLPEGEYTLTVYAVGGSRAVPYYSVSADPSPEELLIPGTPCPPYPLLRVRDVSDEATLPTITQLNSTPVLFGICPIGRQRTRISAIGYALDDCNQQIPLTANDSRFEYSFTIFNGPNPTPTIWSHQNWAEFCLDCGCYEVEVRVRRSGCPVVRTHRREIVVTPPNLPCTPGRRFDYLYPQPAPGGTIGIVGLNDPNHRLGVVGYADRRPMQFSVLVSPNCQCPNNQACPAALTGEIEFDLGARNASNQIVALGANFRVLDALCPNQGSGAKYFLIEIDDLGRVPASSLLDDHDATDVWLVGRARNRGEPWQCIGLAMYLYNPPEVLETSSWRASFTEPGCYVFSVQSSESSEQQFDLGQSAPIDIDIPTPGGEGAEQVNVEGHEDNGVASGFTSRFSLDNGVWSDEDGVGGMRGDVMGNEISGAPLQVASTGGSGVVAGGGDNDLPEWEWCDGGNIFNYEFQEDIYKGILYQGTIWVIPVSIWASIGFGFYFNVDYQLTFQLHPFSVLQGFEAGCPENSAGPGELSFADAYVYLLADAGINIPATIRADILFGVASVAVELKPETTFSLTPWLEAHAKLPDPSFDIHMYMDARFKLFVKLKACIFWELACLEFPEGNDSPIINQPLFDCNDIAPGLFDCVCPGCIETCEDPLMRECADSAGAVAGGEFIPVASIHELITIPESAVSPNGNRILDIWMSADDANVGILNLRETVGSTPRDIIFTLSGPNPFFLDPSATYISDNVALVAFTETNGNLVEDVPELNGSNTAAHVAAANRNAARTNIRVHPLTPNITSPGTFINSGRDVSEGSQDVSSWRVDGSASLAGSPATQSAWMAWVRYEDDFLEARGTREIAVPCEICPVGQPFILREVPDIQPKIDTAAIYVHQLTYNPADGVIPVPGSTPTAISDGGINIEPEVAFLADGSLAACVWVHDGLHTNLLDDNRGRNLQFSFWDASVGSWSTATTIIRSNLLEGLQGVLEPRIVMRRKNGTVEGLLAFTALPPGADPNDTGLGGLRYLNTVRFEQLPGGAFSFQDPVRLRGACDAPVYAFDYELGFTLDEVVDELEFLTKHGPDWVVVFNERGVPGTRAASGDVMVSVLGRGQDEWTAPICLTDGERVIQNVSATITPQGGLHSLYLDGGVAQQPIGGFAGRVAGDGSTGVNVLESTLGPDLAVASCKLSQQFPGPGARVTAKVRVENRGFTGSSMDMASGRNLARLEIVYHEADGEERVVTGRRLTMLEPGESEDFELEIEMPLDPVELEARVIGDPDDMVPGNDRVRCDFGAPAPESIDCRVDQRGEVLRVVVEWESPALYDEIFVYRDGLLVACLPGSFERYVDIAPPLGLHEYHVRGCVGPSASRHVRCALVVEPRPIDSDGAFRRGDVNSDGRVDISDPVAALNWLFLGGTPPTCQDAADTNDSGAIDISDSVFGLGFLFTGGPQPPAPGPFTCGEDPSADGLPACESRSCP